MNTAARLEKLEALVTILPPPRESMQAQGGGVYVAQDGRVFMEWGEMMRSTEMLPPDDKTERWSEITEVYTNPTKERRLLFGDDYVKHRPTWKATA